MYKIIALDMDGTLLNGEKKVTDRVKKALNEAREKGVKVVLATGRPIAGVRRYLEELDLYKENEYVLTYNGSLVQETLSGRAICDIGLKGKDLEYFYELSKKLKVNIHAFSTERGLITPKISKYTEVEANINGIPINVVDFNEIKPEEDIVKIMFIDEPEILDRAIKGIPEKDFSNYGIIKSAPYFLEIINKDSNKGIGLSHLAKEIGVKREEVIAVGDAGNDLAMVEYAGLGVAMGNASEEVKNIANYITASNEEDGVAEVIEKFILKK